MIIGKGNTAEVIEYGESKVCKLFYEDYPEEYVQLEYKNAWEMYKKRLPVSCIGIIWFKSIRLL